jgi:hypothetical protein
VVKSLFYKCKAQSSNSSSTSSLPKIRNKKKKKRKEKNNLYVLSQNTAKNKKEVNRVRKPSSNAYPK